MRNSGVKSAVALTMAFAAMAHADIVAGSSSGKFTNPVGDPGLVSTGVGTNHFTWGDGTAFSSPSNFVDFGGKSISSFTNTPFTVGTFTYFNGTTALGTNATGVEMDVTLNLTDPAGVIQLFDFQLGITTTTNTTDPAASADIVNLSNSFSSKTFVANGKTYTLLLNGFVNQNVTQGFVDAAGFHVYEGATGTADLQAEITLASNVPEPGSIVLLLTIGASVVIPLRRRSKKA